MTTLSATITSRQFEVLLRAGLDVPSESLHGGYRRITWPVADTSRIFWTLDRIVPRHALRAIPYRKLQVAVFKALRAARARGIA